MTRQFTLRYWQDGAWFVGRLQEVPAVFSQGESLSELEANIRDVYRLLVQDAQESLPPGALTKELPVEV